MWIPETKLEGASSSHGTALEINPVLVNLELGSQVVENTEDVVLPHPVVKAPVASVDIDEYPAPRVCQISPMLLRVREVNIRSSAVSVQVDKHWVRKIGIKRPWEVKPIRLLRPINFRGVVLPRVRCEGGPVAGR